MRPFSIRSWEPRLYCHSISDVRISCIVPNLQKFDPKTKRLACFEDLRSSLRSLSCVHSTPLTFFALSHSSSTIRACFSLLGSSTELYLVGTLISPGSALISGLISLPSGPIGLLILNAHSTLAVLMKREFLARVSP